VLGEVAVALRAALDPLGLDGGPPLVEIEGDVAAASGGPALAVRHLGEALTSRRLRDRVDGLESAMAETTLQQTAQLELAREETLQRLGRLAEYRDDNSWEHTERVAQLAARLAARLDVPRRTIELLRRTAPLHDIGKIAIPDAILLKPGKLSPHEFEVIKTHTVVGAQVLGGGTSDLIRVGEQVVRSHHERWDGTGYPDGLAGEDIPLVARLVQVADVFDILMHERPHKEAWLLEDAAAEIERGAGTQFDPAIVAAFMDLGPDVWRAPAPMRYAMP
jgi:putative two-component system response regulator